MNENYTPKRVSFGRTSTPFVQMQDGKARRIIKPLHLAQGDTTRILTHGGQWVDKVRRLRKRNALPADVMFPVTTPATNTKPYEAFQEIRDELLEARVQVVPANDEGLILKFATQV